MKYTLQDRLLRRELGNVSRYSNLRGIYGDRSWVEDLDIVNELGGHSGCVNALSWSTSGRLLASGSDDQHLNIHAYQPDDSATPFALTTTVATGHSANIFSVKFMPHSQDRTLVTAAGDAEVRVFDIEYAGRTTESSSSASIASSLKGQRFQNLYKGVRYLSDGNTNSRVYRSHSDRVKRIVTESSPNLFLTCSEDGEVRQFDLRLPSSAYPPARGGRFFLAHRADHDNSNVPPPLISYKRFNLDLNTISCSPSQPHYIALGGAHLHCFLHDRRMLGRDNYEERGEPGRASPAGSMNSSESELMGQATRCVRKFAPEGRKTMKRTDSGHITACKISDANPNELIASWSGDHIYSFDLVRSPDASEINLQRMRRNIIGNQKGKARESGERKRKRPKAGSSGQEWSRRSPRLRHARSSDAESNEMALRVRYENGQIEDISVNDVASALPQEELQAARLSVLTESQKRSMRIAERLVKIRRMIFSLEASAQSAGSSLEPASHTASFTSALGLAASCLPEMDEISTTWAYPINPLEEDVVLQSTLRANRDSSRRFVQAAGTLAKSLGGRLQTASSISSPAMDLFNGIVPATSEGQPQSLWEVFRYDFLRAILLWLGGGRQALVEGFKLPANQRRNNPRFPVPTEAGEAAIDDIIIPYLLYFSKDTDSPVPNIDASRFERDTTRQIFGSENQAVRAFAHAVRIPPTESAGTAPSSDIPLDLPPVDQDHETALKFWAMKVGRGLLMNAAEGVNFQFVDTAYGGLGRHQPDTERSQEEIDADEDDIEVQDVTLINRRREASVDQQNTRIEQRSRLNREDASDIDLEDAGSDAELVAIEDLHNGLPDSHETGVDTQDFDHSDNSAEDDDEDSDDEDETNDDDTADGRTFMFQSASDRGKIRERVERSVQCHSHVRQYRGHCNVKTVKDANYFGLQDEYVVSGSDGGHVFIWDRRTSELVNILEGDGEVVNVIQGHPYEPMLAVSGIDNTIKIFSPDQRAQRDAEEGINISSAADDSPVGGSLRSSLRRRRSGHEEDQSTRNDHEGLTSRKRMHQSYQIMGHNDAQRQGGMRDAFITRRMLAQLAARLRARQGNDTDGLGGVVLGQDGETVIIEENCTVM